MRHRFTFTSAFAIVALAMVASHATPVEAHYYGKLRVQGSGSTTAISRSLADGDEENPCEAVLGAAEAPLSGSVESVQVTPLLNPPLGCDQGAALPAGLYKVYVYSGKLYTISPTGVYKVKRHPCFEPGCVGQPYTCLAPDNALTQLDPEWLEIGNIVVGTDGNGSAGPFGLPSGLSANAASETSGVCISNGLPKGTRDRGNQVPFHLTT